ncbi:MAG TPA: GNAT family N-acetyltransferase [Actinomycetota bacterium]|nr:GNAT family N-acetyltransferase [Actinomycetota bacterium]
MAVIRVAATPELARAELVTLRRLLDEAFEEGFTDDDWAHTIGGHHVLAEENGAIASHASVVPRMLTAGEVPLRTGYVEGVATPRSRRGRGLGSAVMNAVADIIRARYELGALATGLPEFYLRLGWERWRGPTYTDAPEGRLRTADDDDAVLILRTSVSAELDVTRPLTCDWRTGDVW